MFLRDLEIALEATISQRLFSQFIPAALVPWEQQSVCPELGVSLVLPARAMGTGFSLRSSLFRFKNAF